MAMVLARRRAGSEPAWHNMHVRKGDTVVVISGKNRQKRGKVLAVDRIRNRVTVEGVNIVKRHTKPNRALPQGGIVEKEAPVHVSNVQLLCQRCDRPVRTGGRLLPDGEKVRYCKKCNEVIDNR